MEKGVTVVLLSSYWFCVCRFTQQWSCTREKKKGEVILVDQEMHQGKGFFAFLCCNVVVRITLTMDSTLHAVLKEQDGKSACAFGAEPADDLIPENTY